MRKMMSKEVTKTTVKLAVMEVENGLPVAKPLEDEVLIGNVSQERANLLMQKKHGKNVSVFAVEPETVTYVLPVEEFIQIATIKEPQSDSQD